MGGFNYLKVTKFKKKLVLRTVFVGSLFLCLLLISWQHGPIFCGCLESYALPQKAKWPPEGSVIRCPVLRDTYVSAIGKERFGNNGGAAEVKVKGQQEYTLFDIDPVPLRGKIITGVLLHIRSSSKKNGPLMRVGISTISSQWAEGNSNYYRPEIGSTCFAQAEYKKRDWCYKGSTLMDVVFGHGNSMWRFADCTRPDKYGWQACAIEPDIVAARVAGLSYGFCMADEVGNEWSLRGGRFKYIYFPNRYCYSRKKYGSGPWLEVWTNGTDIDPPEGISSIQVKTRNFPPGEALVTWKTPRDYGGGKTLGFQVDYCREGEDEKLMPRYLVPMAGKPGEEVLMHIHDLPFEPGEVIRLTIRPVDTAGNIGPAITKIVKLSSGANSINLLGKAPRAFPPCKELPTVGGLKVAVVDPLDKIDPCTGRMIPPHRAGYIGGNHIFSSKKKLIRLQSARNETVAFQLNLEGVGRDIKVNLRFDNDPDLIIKAFEFGYVAIKDKFWGTKSYLPDPLIPLKGPVSVPSRSGYVRVPDQKNHSLVFEIYVPHNVPPGVKRGQLIVSANGETLSIKVNLLVWNFTLPNKLSFVPEMNAYGTVSPFKGYGYYRLAHEHRTCINRLPYGWDGRPSFAPEWDGDHFDWSEWDEKVGPLLDGSAFKNLPRKGEPVDVFYLPFNENWPVSIFENYRPSYWPDEAFSEKYKTDLSKAFGDFAKHCSEMGWNDTVFQFYLNNKIYYRKRFRRCSAPWIFDEPVNTQDFWALRWYGILWHQAVEPVKGMAKMWYRADISYTQFARNILWGITDIEYLGGNNFQKTRMKQEEQVLSKRKSYYAEYGTANPIDKPNTQPVLWCLSAWSKGAVGVLPWQTIGTKKAWSFAQQTCLFYPDPEGPIPSVRLKAFRRGQQDVEYAVLLWKSTKLPKYIIEKWLRDKLPLAGSLYKVDETDAWILNFNNAGPMELWKVRYVLGEAISTIAPEYRRKLMDLSLKPWDITCLPNIGYVSVSPSVPPYKPQCIKFSPSH